MLGLDDEHDLMAARQAAFKVEHTKDCTGHVRGAVPLLVDDPISSGRALEAAHAPTLPAMHRALPPTTQAPVMSASFPSVSTTSAWLST
mmetsp:Transcript_28956/g.68662  ORF Transcript_28956/g.68662 Transcript_28956/m.68662 type:complete len:89 (+) Transcript_28956:338-604(+)